MRIWRFHAFGSVEEMRLDEIPIPEPGAGEALVRVAYAALNPADAFMVAGKYPRPGTPPYAVGRDGSGWIERVGAGSRFAVGDAVVLLRSDVGVNRDGTLAEYVVVPEASLAPLPAGWTMEEGAAGPLTLLTAWQALVDSGELRAGQNVLVTGASGGVGTAAIILAKGLGARVAALSRSVEKRRELEALGADWTFDSEAPDLVKEVQRGIGGRADVVVENLAGPFLQKSIDMAGLGARICVVGLLAGLKSEVEIGRFIFKQIKIIGIAVGNYSEAEAQAAWEKIVEVMAREKRRPIVDRVFEFDEVKQAFAWMGRGVMGKVLVRAGG
jgi:NADPH2:quinone reductase